MQIGAEKPAAEPNAEADENWENAFSGSDSEDQEIDLPPRLMDDIASDIFVSGFLWENGLKPVYKVGENDKKIIEIKLKNGETIILKEDEDFCYGYDGTPYFTKDFIKKNGHIALIGNNSQSDTKEGTIVNEAGNIYGINYDIAENGYGMIIDVAEEDISKWQDPSWMTSEKQYDSLDEKYGEIYSQWKVTQGFNDPNTNNQGHLAIDMVPQDLSKEGADNIYSIFPGKVKLINRDKTQTDNGVCIVIEHNINGYTFYSAYAHLKEDSIPDSLKEGDPISIEDKIGVMGGTKKIGYFSEHLHLTVFTGNPTYKFFGYYQEGNNAPIPGDPFYSKTLQSSRGLVFYDPLKVMQSNGLIIYHNIENDDNLKSQKQ